MKKFCPKCGKTITSGVFCEDCKERKISYKPLKVKLCPSKRAFYQGSWSKFQNLHELTKKLVKNKVKDDVTLIEGLERYPDILQRTGMKAKKEIIVLKNKYEYKIPITVEITYSPKIKKIDSTYFEGILQIKNARKEIKDYIKKYILTNSKQIFVNKVEDKGNRVDYFFAEKKFIRPLALKLQRKYGGFIQENSHHHSYDHEKGQDIHRYNNLIVFPSFVVKSIIELDNKPYQVTNLGKLISARNLNNHKKTSFKYYKDLHEEIKIMKKHKTTVSQKHPNLEVIHPKTYQSIKTKNPYDKEVTIGQKTKVILHKNKPYIV